MSVDRTPLIGRDGEVAEVADALRSTGSAARSLLVTGGAGSGKTAVVEQARRGAVEEGAKVLRLDWQRISGSAGASALAEAVCGVLAKIHDGRLPVRVGAVRRVQSRAVGGGGELALLSTLGEVLADAAHHVPFALILDDVQRMPVRTASALGLLLRAFRPTGVAVVMAGRPMDPGQADGGQLHAAADRVLELPPLLSADVAELIVQWLGRPAEPALVTAVLGSLGPLAGNPAAVLSVLASVDTSGLLEIDGRVCLADSEERLRLTTDAMELGLGRPDEQPDADTIRTAAALAGLVDDGELRLDDLHNLELPGGPPEVVVRTLDRLVRDQVLAVDQGGRITFVVPAFAAALRTPPTQGDVRSLHARITTSVTDRLGPVAAGAAQPWLAGHVAAAGPMVDDALAVPLLLAAARGEQVGRPRAVRGYLAALRRLSPDDNNTPGLLRESVDVSLRHADHSGVLALGEPLMACLDGRHGENSGDLDRVTRAWILSALHEHRPSHSDDADPRYRKALERVPAATELAALGGLYGIGATPLTLRSGPFADCVPATDRESGSGPVPSHAEARLLAAAVGGSAEFERARRSLPEDALDEAALDRLRNGAAYGDLAGALEAVLGERYVAAGDSTAVRYQVMVRDYLNGNWDSALSCARRIEVRGRVNGMGGVGQLARALAAEIQLLRGAVGRGHAWLDLIPGSVTHPLVARVRLGLRYSSARRDEAVEEAWRDVRTARENGLLAGLERVVQRILWIGVLEDSPDVTRRALEELEALHEEMATPMTHEVVLFGRAVVRGDMNSALAAHRLARQRGDMPFSVHSCACLAEVSDDPQPWLAEMSRVLHSLDVGRSVGSLIGPAARRRNVPLPRYRAPREGLSRQDVQLIEMVSGGSTNRQIAARLACSEKTTEQRLTRLYQRAGCRSRSELAVAWLDGSLSGLGPVPEAGRYEGSQDGTVAGPGGD